VQFKAAAALLALARRAEEHRDLMITGRTHNVPAQPTTLGKRLAMFGQELLMAFERLDELIDRYPVRGLKGAVGTQLDQLTLLGGRRRQGRDPREPRAQAPRLPGLARNASGQVYPRGAWISRSSARCTRSAPPRRASPRRCASWPGRAW
jgi:adenylosuccinate lyase